MLAALIPVAALCPMQGAMPPDHPPVLTPRRRAATGVADYDAVRADIRSLLTDSQEAWPADYGNYAPLFVRLAWHNSGSYRNSDGRGGADGGRQRFDPERSWADNTNLDKARSLLWPIKLKHGLSLSWGDLIILAGNTAIETMGGPVLGFCGGRIDDEDGSESVELGPTAVQERLAPCPVNGTCKPPLGSTTVGLIYVNPEGPLGVPDPVGSARAVRDTFARMAMNDSETVALIGGGHAFGKTHGACPAGAGPSPKEDPSNPWPGRCGTGKLGDAFTSGFEGPWTATPTKWDNKYFQYLSEFEYEVWRGPGNHSQWRVKGGAGPTAPSADGKGRQAVMMLTSDISLTRDPKGLYQPLVWEFAASLPKLERAFAHAWYKLTSRDMGPISRCEGNNVPPPQDWQFPLPPPPPPNALVDFDKVAADLRSALKSNSVGERALLSRLAWSCASTFRHTDYQGGCNGARIRFAPQRDWKSNAGLDAALDLIEPLKRRYGSGLSWADLIVLAGNTALEGSDESNRTAASAGGGLGNKLALSFCGGRTDANDAGSAAQQEALSHLKPRIHGDANDTAEALKYSAALMGLSTREIVSLKQQVWRLEPQDGEDREVDNEYFKTLLGAQWSLAHASRGVYEAKGTRLRLQRADMLLKWDDELLAAAQEFAEDNSLFVGTFAAAWTKMMNADRFAGPAKSTCEHGGATWGGRSQSTSH